MLRHYELFCIWIKYRKIIYYVLTHTLGSSRVKLTWREVWSSTFRICACIKNCSNWGESEIFFSCAATSWLKLSEILRKLPRTKCQQCQLNDVKSSYVILGNVSRPISFFSSLVLTKSITSENILEYDGTLVYFRLNFSIIGQDFGRLYCAYHHSTYVLSCSF